MGNNGRNSPRRELGSRRPIQSPLDLRACRENQVLLARPSPFQLGTSLDRRTPLGLSGLQLLLYHSSRPT